MSAKWPGEVVGWITWSCSYPRCAARLTLPTCADDREVAKRLGWTEHIPPGKSSWDVETYCPQHAMSCTETKPEGAAMTGLDDVREWDWKGVETHGWSAVLKTLDTMLSDNADDMQAAGHPRTADDLSKAASHVRNAAKAVYPGVDAKSG